MLSQMTGCCSVPVDEPAEWTIKMIERGTSNNALSGWRARFVTAGPGCFPLFRRREAAICYASSGARGDLESHTMQILIKLLSGKTLTLEVEGTTTIEELKSMIEADVDCPEAAEQCLLIGEGKGTRMENGMTVADYEVQKEAEIRLVPRQRPAPHASQTQMAEAMAQAMAFQQGIARRWDELYDSVAVLESRKRTAARRHGVRGKVKERLKLTVGGERVDVKRSTLCTPFPRSKLDALFSGRWECALLRDPRDTKRLFLDLNPACFRLLVEFCIDQQQHEPGEPLELPAVAPELESTLHLTFRLFGLDYLFEEKREGIAEADPPADAEPEPELEEDLEDCAAAEVEVVVADGAAVSLPPRTVDRVISARYGSLDQAGKWIDVTAAVAEQLDYDGAIELEVHSKTFAADPHEGAEKSLSVRYARCQKWERSSISDVFRTAQVATERARRALRTAIADHQLHLEQFEQEQTWIQQFFAAKPAPAAPEVVQISLLGEVVYTKRTTLMLCAAACDCLPPPAGGDGAVALRRDSARGGSACA